MRTVFIHGEVDQFLEAKEALTTRFSAWCAERDLEAPVVLAEFLLGDKFVHDGLLASWNEHELHRFLVDVVPRRLALDDEWIAVVDFLHLWVDFLGDLGLLMSGASRIPALHKAIDRAVHPYLSAMADPREWSPAKFWTVTMAEHGVSPDDEAAVDRFFNELERGQIHIDSDIAEQIEERDEHEPVPQPAYWLPPVASPEEDATSAEAPKSAIVERMTALCEWIGEGRQADTLGGLGYVDLTELGRALGTEILDTEVAVEWAKNAHLIRQVGTSLVRTRICTPQLRQPALLWTKLWQNFVLLEGVFSADASELDDFDEEGEAFLELQQQALRTLYSRPEAIPLELIVDMTLGALRGDEVLADIPVAVREELRLMARRVFDQWEVMGVVRRFVTTQADQVALIDSAVPAGMVPDHTMLELMPLGVEAARGSLQAFGFTVPSVEDIVDSPLEVLVVALSESPPEVIDDVVRALIEKRGRAVVSAELADLLRRVDDPLVRLTSLWLLEHTGEEGVAVARGLCSDPIAASSARMWLQTKPGAQDVEAEPDDELRYALDGMAVSAAEDAESFLLEFQAQPEAEQLTVVERIPNSRHVRAGAVLEVLAEGHPDARIAGMARQGLEKVRG